MQEYSNLTIEVKGKTVVITIKDHTKDLGLSSSGKSHIVATTSGNVQINDTDGLTIGLNAYRKAR